MSPKQKIILAHLAFWVLYITVNYSILAIQMQGNNLYVLDSICKYSIAAFIFYVTAFLLLPVLFVRKRYLLFAVSIAAMSILSFVLKEGMYQLLPLISDYPAETPYSQKQSYLMNLWWWSQYTLWAFGYWFAMEAIKKEKALRVTREAQLQAEKENFLLEKENLLLENAHLRAQINPHFLFNTLTFFFNEVNDTHPEVAEGIVALTDIMRSAIQRPDKNGRIPLEEEAASIENLIRIYQLRYNNELCTIFESEGDFSCCSIIPHVLITLVENALNHGDLHDLAHPLIVRLRLIDGLLSFMVLNRKRGGPKNPSHGIGMQYVKRQLEFAYQDRFTLEINEDTDQFRVDLSITFNRPAPQPASFKLLNNE